VLLWGYHRHWHNWTSLEKTSIDIHNIIEAMPTNRLRISDHADEEAAVDQLSFDEIFFAVLHGEIIEDYPTDTSHPSCLV